MRLLLALTTFACLTLPMVSHAFPSYATGGFRGSELMTEAERKTHADTLQAMQKYNECRAYMETHNQEIDKRAQAAGVQLPPVKGNPCDVMRLFGRVK